MDWQQLVSLAIVAGAAAGLAGSRFRRHKLSLERKAPCGCSGAGAGALPGSMVFRRRKGGRGEVRVRMR
jgi:hypothetical protein